ncbi:hypothetical protein N8310_04640 [Pseudomonadota bacterium]|nr:hypothetical protein [Pseudomonadota bacterium]
MTLDKKKIIIIIILLKLLATSFALMVFDQFSPLVDARLYENEFFLNGYALNTSLRTDIVQGLVRQFNYIFYPIVSHYIFSIISILGIIWYVVSNKFHWAILLIFIFPSSMIWTSVIGKEAIYYLFFSLLIIIWSNYISEKLKARHYLIAVVAILFCLMFRLHYTIAILWLFWAAININKFKNYKMILFCTYSLILILLFVVLFKGMQLNDLLDTNFPDVKWRAYSSIAIEGKASRHSSLGFTDIRDKCINDKLCDWDIMQRILLDKKINSHFITGFIFGIIGPFFNEIINRPVFIPFFIEGVLIILLPFMFLIYFIFTRKVERQNIYYLNYIYGVLPAILLVMIMHAFFGMLNPGSAIRWRVNFELIFYLAPFLIYLNLIEKNK